MNFSNWRGWLLLSALWAVLTTGCVSVRPDGLSHPAMRPLPEPSRRPLTSGTSFFVDGVRGDDMGSGSEAAPWRTIGHGLGQLGPGATLYLRGGVYYETVAARLRGEPENPIVIRSYPGELAVIDAGYAAFAADPRNAWTPFDGGALGEYVSVGVYPELGAEGLGRRNVGVVGNFADSMIPLHGYHSITDLRADPAVVDVGPKDQDQGLYCGPGLWFNPETGRIHVRLAHTVYDGLGEENYGGPTDPRRLPLVVGGRAPAMSLTNAAHVVLQDLVLRGTRGATLRIVNGATVLLDHVSVYGGSPAVTLTGTEDLRMVDCAVRGVSAPWSSRASQKYRGLSSYLLAAGAGNRRVEMTHCEFTDSHDGLVIGSVDELRFHFNLVENFNDDGLYLTSGYPPGSDVQITQNRIARCLSSLSFAGSGKGQDGKTAYIARNVFDLREPVNRSHTQMGVNGANARPCGDHGSPIWKPMMIYQNTFLLPDSPWRQFYGSELTRGNIGNMSRRIFNNIFLYTKGTPGLLPQLGDLVVDGNLHWSMDFEGAPPSDLLQEARARGTYVGKHDWFEASKQFYPAGSTAHDIIADPALRALAADGSKRFDAALRKSSPAVDAGVPLSADWPDPLAKLDRNGRDIGAFPLGVEMWTVGIEGRVTLDGRVRK